jgi:phosphomannomutase
MFVDENGRFIQPDLITAVIGTSLLRKNTGDGKPAVLQDIRTSRSVTEYLEKLGAEVHTWKVGHAFAKMKMREINAVFGGELAGHYYFRDFYNCDSGILASLLVLDAAAQLKEQGRTFSGLIDTIITYAGSGEINFRIERKDEAMEALKVHFTEQEAPEKLLDIDGYRIEYRDWWFNVRPSNTEPYLRLVTEAKTPEMLQEKLEEIRGVLKQFE